eukprot:7989776-Pyramimonas_sp.AAC.1
MLAQPRSLRAIHNPLAAGSGAQLPVSIPKPVAQSARDLYSNDGKLTPALEEAGIPGVLGFPVTPEAKAPGEVRKAEEVGESANHPLDWTLWALGKAKVFESFMCKFIFLNPKNLGYRALQNRMGINVSQLQMYIPVQQMRVMANRPSSTTGVTRGHAGDAGKEKESAEDHSFAIVVGDALGTMRPDHAAAMVETLGTMQPDHAAAMA